MSEGEPPVQDELGHLLSAKVLMLRDALEHHDIPYAFGGAVALFYYRDPRSTIDVDVNIFVAPERHAGVIEVLSGLYAIDAVKVAADVVATGQSRSTWDTTFIDLFFADTEFHDLMARRVRREPFLGTEIRYPVARGSAGLQDPVRSAQGLARRRGGDEDVGRCARPGLCGVRAPALPRASDPRFERWRRLPAKPPDGQAS